MSNISTGNDRAALYARVSTDEQNLENQLETLRSYADRHDYEYDVFKEKESTRDRRPVKEELLEDLRQKKYDALLVYKLDRWARSTRELILDIEELYEKGVDFVSITDNIDMGTSTGRLQFKMLAAFAEFERDLISERTKEGLRRSDKKPGPDKWDFNQRRAAHMLFEEDASYREVAEELGISKATVGRFKNGVRENPPSYLKDMVDTKPDEHETEGTR